MARFFISIALLMMSAITWAADSPTDGYRDFNAITQLLKSWQAEHADTSQLTSIGQSPGGRDIWLMTVSGEGVVPSDQRPALLIGANAVGYHQAGTEAALHFTQWLLTSDDASAVDMRQNRTLYIAPVLNPDAHDSFFATPRYVRRGNGLAVDTDVDGLLDEDPFDDLDGNGVITKMRIADPSGNMVAADTYTLRRADASKGERGTYRVLDEGTDNDRDGRFNEDGAGGVIVDRNFSHEFEYATPEAGLWAGYAPESRAVMDFALDHRNIAAAIIFGPANYYLAPPQGSGRSIDTGNTKLDIPTQIAGFIGLDPDTKYTVDEVWDAAKSLPMVVQNNFTKEDLVQFLGLGPATKPTDGDLKWLAFLAKPYKAQLKDIEHDRAKPAGQSNRGGLAPWLYYHYGAWTVELDVWGLPKAPKPEGEASEETAKLTVDGLADMSAEDFLAFGEEAITAFMKEAKVPPQFTAQMVIQRVEAGQLTPAQMATMLERMGAGESKSDDEEQPKKDEDLLHYLDNQAPWAKVEWTPVTLPDGTQAEVGGIDPFATINPPEHLLEPLLPIHTQAIAYLSDQLAIVDLRHVTIDALGSDVFRVKVVAGNAGQLPTHSDLAKKNRQKLPVLMRLELPEGVERLDGPAVVKAPSLAGKTGTIEGTWLLKGPAGTSFSVVISTEHAGTVVQALTLQAGGAQ